MTCPRCHTPIAPSDRYCINCGADIALISQNVNTAEIIANEQQDRATNSDPGRGWSDSATDLKNIRRRGTGGVLLWGLVYLSLFAASAVVAYWVLEFRRPAPDPDPGQGTLAPGKPRLVAPTATPTADQAADAAGKQRSRGSSPRTPRIHRARRTTGTRATTKPGSGGELGPVEGSSHAVSPKQPAAAAGDSGAPKPTGAPAGTAPVADAGPARASPASKPGSPMGSAEKFRVSLNVGSVQLVVRHYLPQLRLCYGRAIKQGGVRGTVEIQFTVNELGKVSEASVHRGHRGVGQCIVGKLRTWRFPRPVGGAMTFIYPFRITG